MAGSRRHTFAEITWQSSETTFTASASGDSARLHLRCQGGTAGSQVVFDNMHLEP